MESVCNSQERERRLQRVSMNSFTANRCLSRCHCRWILVDCVSCASGQTVSMLGGALTDPQRTPNRNTTRQPEKLVFVKCVSLTGRPLALLSRLGPLRRTFTLSVRRVPRVHIRTDASPCGFGRLIIRHGRPKLTGPIRSLMTNWDGPSSERRPCMAG